MPDNPMARARQLAGGEQGRRDLLFRIHYGCKKTMIERKGLTSWVRLVT